MFFWRGLSPPFPLKAPLGMGSGVTLKGKMTSFLKSPPLKTLELIYNMFFYGKGIIISPSTWRAPGGEG